MVAATVIRGHSELFDSGESEDDMKGDEGSEIGCGKSGSSTEMVTSSRL